MTRKLKAPKILGEWLSVEIQASLTGGDMTWNLQDAKNRFSMVCDRAMTEGPQRVTRHGKDAVVIVSADDWAEQTDQGRSLADFFMDSPLAGSELQLNRDPSPLRPVDL
jgi:prevent-host-death family protein